MSLTRDYMLCQPLSLFASQKNPCFQILWRGEVFENIDICFHQSTQLQKLLLMDGDEFALDSPAYKNRLS